jgi:hypothetical protein
MSRSGGEFPDAAGGGERRTDWAGGATGGDAVAKAAIGKPGLGGIGIELETGSTTVAMLGLGSWVGSARTTAGVTSPAGSLVAAECHSHKTRMAPAANEATAHSSRRA